MQIVGKKVSIVKSYRITNFTLYLDNYRLYFMGEQFIIQSNYVNNSHTIQLIKTILLLLL